MKSKRVLSLSHKFILVIIILLLVLLPAAIIAGNYFIRFRAYQSFVDAAYYRRMVQAHEVGAWLDTGIQVVDGVYKILPYMHGAQIVDVVVSFHNQFDFIESLWVATHDGEFL